MTGPDTVFHNEHLSFYLQLFFCFVFCVLFRFHQSASGLLHLAPPADSDPGLLPGRGHQLRTDLGHLTLQLLELQLAHQAAEQDSGHGISKSGEQKKGEKDSINFEK